MMEKLARVLYSRVFLLARGATSGAATSGATTSNKATSGATTSDKATSGAATSGEATSQTRVAVLEHRAEHVRNVATVSGPP